MKKDMAKCEKKCSKLDQEHQLHTLEFEQLQKDIESFAKQRKIWVRFETKSRSLLIRSNRRERRT